MKVGIVSDSHDNLPAVDAALAAFRGRAVQMLIHAGDFVAPFAVKRFLSLDVPMLAVFGNCDGEKKALASLLPGIAEGARRETVDGKNILIVHSIDSLEPTGAGGVDLIVCGHTHQPTISGDRPLVINPGECGGWVTGRSTAAVLDTDTMTAELLELNA